MWIGAPAKYHSEARTLCGVSWRRRHAERAAEPARIVELPAKIKIILQTIYHAISRHLRAWFVHRPFHKQKPQPNCSIEVFVGGRRWIRTTEVVDNRFTVCSLWPLGNPPKFYPTKCPRFAVVLCGAPVFLSPRRGQWARSVELVNGIEPSTC